MRAVRNTENGIEVLEVPAPEGEGVRVRVRSAGICGSDLHMISYGPLPVTLGHEFAGLLDDETPVAVQPNVACGTCDRCRAGADQQCRSIFANIHGISRDGGLADEVLVDESCLVRLPEGVDVGSAALVEPIAVAVHGLNRAGGDAKPRVLVIGGGSIGLVAIAAARHRGSEVDLAARHKAQFAAGEKLGAGLEPKGEYDVVIDAAGTSDALESAVTHARPGGTILVLANYWGEVKLPPALVAREVSLVPSFMYGHHHGAREFEEAAEVLTANPDVADALVTHRFSLDRAAEAFRTAAGRAAGAIKVMLGP